MNTNPKKWRPWLITVVAILLMALLSPFMLSAMVCHAVEAQICDTDIPVEQYDAILILGCGVKENGDPSDMLQDRLRTGIFLYHAGVAPKILLSGDHEHDNYNEIAAMKRVCLDAGVPEQDILSDRYGLSTYDSLTRAATLYEIRRVVIVTQTYHLYRALYIAHKKGMEAIGVDADIRTYRLQWYRDLREVLARCKDFYTTQRDVPPAYMAPGGEN